VNATRDDGEHEAVNGHPGCSGRSDEEAMSPPAIARASITICSSVRTVKCCSGHAPAGL
jgi:hypothetical protein